MLSQLLNLEFFHFLYTFYEILNKQVENRNKLGDLVDQGDRNSYA